MSKATMERKPRLADKNIDPFVPRADHHNPRELRSWAKRTGFVSRSLFSSGESAAPPGRPASDLEKGPDPARPGNGRPEIAPETKRSEKANGSNGTGSSDDGEGEREVERKKESEEDEEGLARGAENGEEGREAVNGGRSGIKCGLRDNPGFVPLTCYGLQHFLSMAGSLVFIPVIIVPLMGGNGKDTATVISTMLLLSGVTTLLHSYFGTRLPLVQGSSFVYLAPALVIMNSEEHRNLTDHKFRRIMTEIQGAIIIGSIFQSFLGLSGLMCLLLRVINPIVVAPTVAAIGLAFFSYGFPQAGNCIEISVPLILLVLICVLYLRGISVFGHRLFWIYAVPLSVAITWSYAFFLTAGGAYDYKGCNANIPTSNILNDACRKHASTMQHCRTDASNAWRAALWFRIPYPLQWGLPVFRMRTSIIMIVTSLVASVDSVGTYHTTSVLIDVRPPTPGIVSRGIALEGFCSMLAGLWGSGTGSTTLTENMHTIRVTKIANRRAVQIGAVLLILFSFLGKVGAILASIPLSLAAATLCFIWALIVSLGLSTLQYSQMTSFRNMTIVGISLFFGLSIPAYFQQYQPESTLILPSYLVPYAAASSGPVLSGNKQIDFAMNAILSLNTVITLVMAFILDNTVPGSRHERGAYVWSKSDEIRNDPSSLADYSLPGNLCLPKCGDLTSLMEEKTKRIQLLTQSFYRWSARGKIFMCSSFQLLGRPGNLLYVSVAVWIKGCLLVVVVGLVSPNSKSMLWKHCFYVDLLFILLIQIFHYIFHNTYLSNWCVLRYLSN